MRQQKNTKNPVKEMLAAAIRLPNLAKRNLLSVQDMTMLGYVKVLMQETAQIITSHPDFIAAQEKAKVEMGVNNEANISPAAEPEKKATTKRSRKKTEA